MTFQELILERSGILLNEGFYIIIKSGKITSMKNSDKTKEYINTERSKDVLQNLKFSTKDTPDGEYFTEKNTLSSFPEYFLFNSKSEFDNKVKEFNINTRDEKKLKTYKSYDSNPKMFLK